MTNRIPAYSRDTAVSFIPASGDKSDTGVSVHVQSVSGIPFSGDRSDTSVFLHCKWVSGIPSSGDKIGNLRGAATAGQ